MYSRAFLLMRCVICVFTHMLLSKCTYMFFQHTYVLFHILPFCSKILINPHFMRGGTRPNTSWAPPKTFAEPLLNTPMGNQRFGQPVRQFRAPEPRLQLQPGHPIARAPLVPQQTPRYELIQEALRQRQPAQVQPTH